jgi:transcriptional regulator with PAS, ATPase and Fis domain
LENGARPSGQATVFSESGEFIKVGESKVTKVDVRVVAATNRDLSASEAGKFDKFILQAFYFPNKITITA